jgi:predicted nucleic acid-binding protein
VSVVSNTSPLNYLVLIRHADILPALYQRVLVPPAVMAELQALGTPDIVRSWAGQLPDWLEVVDAREPRKPSLSYLGSGEQEAITLAATLLNTPLLIDDRDGRREAEHFSVKIIGTLGVIAHAAERKLVRVEEVIERLRRTNFRASPRLLKAILDRYA